MSTLKRAKDRRDCLSGILEGLEWYTDLPEQNLVKDAIAYDVGIEHGTQPELLPDVAHGRPCRVLRIRAVPPVAACEHGGDVINLAAREMLIRLTLRLNVRSTRHARLYQHSCLSSRTQTGYPRVARPTIYRD
jgi:hypothetical protein